MGSRKLEMLTINTEWFKGCGICVAFCPKQVLEMNRQALDFGLSLGKTYSV
jgi:2-oxoglutarate ferredoxin oxidoreductase subunit delta